MNGAQQFELVPDPEHSGPREAWYCACKDGRANVLRKPAVDLCPTCHVAAPWLTWAPVAEVSDRG